MAQFKLDVYNSDVNRTNTYTLETAMISEAEELAVKSVSGLFNYSVDVDQLNVGNRPEKIAGKPALQPITLILHDTVSTDIAATLNGWFNLVYDIKGNFVGHPSDYKASGKLIQYNPQGEQVRTWDLFGLWPSAVGFASDFDSDSDSDFVEFTATIEVDRVELVV